MNFLNNITLRRKANRSNPNTSIVSQESSDTFEDSVTDLTNDTSLNEEDQYKQKISQLELQLKNALQQIEVLTLENSTLKQVHNELNMKYATNKSVLKITPDKTTLTKETQTTPNIGDLHCEGNSIEQPPILLHTNAQFTNSKKQPTKHKINILSTNTNNKILSISEQTLSENYKICHYLMPHGNTTRLLSNIETKIQDLTLRDFCIIMIGEEDFRSTNDYFAIILNLRETLKTVKHTNIIICSPTFKYGYNSNLYNWRVEYFNNLLYLDILEHEYAFFLDSNKNLECSYAMFNKNKSIVNNYGMSIIFRDIKKYMIEILQYEGQIMGDVKSNHCHHSLDENIRCQPTSTEENTLFRI